MGVKKWEVEEVEQLEAMIETGNTYKEIGDALGRTDKSINRKANSLGMRAQGKVNVWTDKEIQELRKLVDSGLNNKQIANKMKRTHASINQKISILEIKRDIKYLYAIGEIVNDTLKIVEQTRIKSGKTSRRGYIVKSLAFPDDTNDYPMSEAHLKEGKGDAYLNGHRICEENSLWSVKEARPYIVDIEQAKTIAPRTEKIEIYLQCPSCKRQKKITPHLFMANNISVACTFCSTGTRYPELYFMGYNGVKEDGFIPQQRFEDFKGHIFDFVNYEKRIIVETHGLQHFEESTGYMNHKRTVASDKRKRKYCKENNWTLIELDCRKSSFEFIRNSIANEPLLEDITDDEVQGMLKIMELNKHYPIKEIVHMYTVEMLTPMQIGERLNFSDSAIRNILDKNNIKIRNLSETRLKGKVLDEKSIIKLYTVDKLNTYQIGELYDVSYGVIIRILNDNNIKIRSMSEIMLKGKVLDKENIIKLYTIDKLSASKIGKMYDVACSTITRMLKDNEVDLRYKGKKVRCITTGRVFDSVKDAAKEYNIKSRGNISASINPYNPRTKAGTLPDGTPLTWEYVTDESQQSAS